MKKEKLQEEKPLKIKREKKKINKNVRNIFSNII